MSLFNLDALKALEEEAAEPKEMGGNVLIIDDEPENLFALEKILSAEYKVFATTSPDEALEFVRNERIDVILTDQRMPEKLGTELLKDVKDENDDNVRMILTGYTDVKDLIDCINAGLIYRYLVKPWNSEEIKGVVRQAVDVISQRRTMNRMLPTQVVNRLYPDGMQSVQEGYGKEVECAIMFLDIRGFTTLAESMKGEDAFQLLTSFIRTVGPIVTENHGFIDKYLGDGLLAIFDREESFSGDVVKCIVEITEAIEQYNTENRSSPAPEFREGEESREPLKYGVGVSYGHVILGTVGFRDRIDFTVLGDAVNTAARIEGLTKELGAGVLVHSKILEKAGMEHVPRRAIGDIPLRGKKGLTPLTEILVTLDEASAKQRLAVSELLNEGVAALNAMDNEKAKVCLEKANEMNPNDSVVEHFLRLSHGRSRDQYSRSRDS